jgi:hypothetical protein
MRGDEMNDTDIRLVEALKVDDRPPTADEIKRQRDQLLTLIETQPKDDSTRSRERTPRSLFCRFPLVAAFGVAILVVGIVVSVVAVRPAVAQIEVEQVDGFYEITIIELGEDTSRIESELESLGVDITFDFIPVSPSLEGDLVGVGAGGLASEIEQVIDPDTGQLTMLRVPVQWGGQGLVQLGRPAQSGETYVASASPLASGEALDDVTCGAIFNQPIQDVNQLLSDRGFDTDIRWDHEGVSESLTVEEASGMLVVEVGYTAPDVIQVWVDTTPAAITDEFLNEAVGSC